MDRYTKGVLTVIAAALVAIVVQNSVRTADAQFADCGRLRFAPCHIEITNWPMR